MNNWATDKQVKFIRSLLKNKGFDKNNNGDKLLIENKVFKISFLNKSGIFGGVLFSEASKLIDALIKNNFELKEKGVK